MTDQPTRAIPTTPTELEDGRFVVGEMLGSGGMAVVVAAEDTMLHRTVAVKLLADALAYDGDARERFSREARSMAALNHPNVVQVYDVGQVDERRPYFIMEHVPGGSLADRLRESGALPAEEVDRIAVESLRGLAAAHDAGLLHRDLKPANLLVAADGTVKVTDFGVARAAESQTLTRTGIVLGTMRYLAPERLRGEGSTEASDLYGLAATLFELLTAAGLDPKKEPYPLKRVPAGTPGPLRTFLERALAEDPARRPASAEEALALWGQDAERTRTLPIGDDTAPTRRVEHDAPTEAHAIEEQVLVPPRDEAGTGGWYQRLGRSGRRRLLIGTAVLALLLALAAVSDPAGDAREGAEAPQGSPSRSAEGGAGTDGDDSTDGGDGGGDGGGGIPAGDSPLDTARNTADWLRDLGG